ncbi:unnamed protein product [Aureobasidium uvarum]|uniref:Glycosyl transferase family 25 domain-containing protein n=1 Tax=Aureobasidium uvarum TaxID=2773716 RepID=A0A9N8K848_9PEZI|nr:unnamed protein product [Aureobasidium uvarum]
MHFPTPKMKKTNLCTIGASGLIVVCVLLLVFHGSSSIKDDSYLDFPSFSATTRSRPSTGDIQDVYNETLGKIFLVSLPERTDRRDSFTLQARLSNMSFEVIDGVDGATVPEKALPYTMVMSPPEIGCWRAHLNIMQDMVANNIATALVFEDDADWDVGIRAQMRELARGSRWLGNTTGETAKPISPYGDDWDILWVGHCSTKSGSDPRRWVVPHDPTVAPPNYRMYQDQPDMRTWESGPDADNQTRIIFVASWGFCTTGYAVSLRGAMKMLYHQSLSKFNNAVDTGLALMCANPPAASNFRCIAPYPAMIGVSRPAGNVDKFSDINYEKFGNVQPLEEARSDGLVFSVHQNIDRLVAGQAELKSQYPENTGETMYLDDILAAVGHGEIPDPWVETT